SVLKTFNKKELERRFEQSTYFFYTTTIKENDSQALGKDLMPLFFEPIFLQQPINDVDYIVRPDLFFQTNHEVAGKLVSYVTAQVKKKKKSVLDIYCGSGLLSIALAKQGFQVYGIEVQYPAIKCAKQSSIVAGTENLTTFQTGKADAIMQKLHENKRTFATIIVDPPRAGLHKNVIELLPKLGANQIIYISCNPSTLARDAKDLIALGYALKKTTPFEMFPMTYHMETVCTFENENIS
ncbi:MAG: class I SAM-dependent RNA methyltransferase, partial [Deltaproteobacteria bacterium]|nr:class I SAM-dependent RNA methyltransferase [Deltaproteobacteria bacterium]